MRAKMKNKWYKFIAPMLLLTLLGLSLTGGEKAMADTILYRASLANNKNHIIIVRQSGKDLTISLEGFGSPPVILKANGGGVSTCRTIIEHKSAQTTVVLSLPIPDPRAACRMLPGFISVESQTPSISIDEENVKKIAGGNTILRNNVKKILGKIDEEEG